MTDNFHSLERLLSCILALCDADYSVVRVREELLMVSYKNALLVLVLLNGDVPGSYDLYMNGQWVEGAVKDPEELITVVVNRMEAMA